MEFIEKNELLLMDILEKSCEIDPEEFVLNLNGMELLLLLYEKHKTEEVYLTKIGDSLCRISLIPKFRSLFVQSGWLRRLNQMSIVTRDDMRDNLSLSLIRQLISHKIIYNLNSFNDLMYSTMIYPMNPLFENISDLPDTSYHHDCDIIFIHGLRGSVFKTWRMDNVEFLNDKKKFTKLATERIINKINDLISIHQSFPTYSWAKDWLPLDLINKSIG